MSALTSNPLLKRLASLKLTVVLFALSIFLVFAGTLAQIDEDIWFVMRFYFRQFITYIELQLFFPRSWNVPGGFWFPGGWTLGFLMLFNLLAAHAVRFKIKAKGSKLSLGLVLTVVGTAIMLVTLSEILVETFYIQLLFSMIGALVLVPAFWLLFDKRSGIALLHAGIIVLLLSELLTGIFAVESQMNIETGSYADYTQDTREFELAIVDESDPDENKAVIIPEWILRQHAAERSESGEALTKPDPIRNDLLPFEVHVEQVIANSVFEGWTMSEGAPPVEANIPNLATKGIGSRIALSSRPAATGTGGDTNFPAAYLRFTRNGEDLGTHLVHTVIDAVDMGADTIEVDDKTYRLNLRFKRIVKDYRFHLVKVTHENFLGTDIPSNFESEVLIQEDLADNNPDNWRRVLIYMNHPLRFRGETFYQSTMNANVGRTGLQVVRNPAWGGPYVSCIMVAIGMTLHFWLTLQRFMEKQAK